MEKHTTNLEKASSAILQFRFKSAHWDSVGQRATIYPPSANSDRFGISEATFWNSSLCCGVSAVREFQWSSTGGTRWCRRKTTFVIGCDHVQRFIVGLVE